MTPGPTDPNTQILTEGHIMTDHTEDQNLTALALRNITDARVAGQHVRAAIVVGALEAERNLIEPADLADLAFEAWEAFADGSVDIPDSIGADVLIRLTAFVHERTAVNMADTLFGDREANICLHDGRAVRWMPDDDTLLVTYPLKTPGKPTTSTTVVLVRDRDIARAL